jgi:hypothetical protein
MLAASLIPWYLSPIPPHLTTTDFSNDMISDEALLPAARAKKPERVHVGLDLSYNIAYKLRKSDTCPTVHDQQFRVSLFNTDPDFLGHRKHRISHSDSAGPAARTGLSVILIRLGGT